MECQSCLNDPTAFIVADTSVAINLNATGYADAILDALPNQFVVLDEVSVELEEDRRNGRNDADALSALVGSQRIEIVRLDDTGLRHFTSLVSGPAAQTLDDGEAATIAYAVEHGATALIDERKANRICAERYPKLAIGCSVDLFAHEKIRTSLGADSLADAVFNALYYGRMRVLAHHVDWVVGLIGPDRAALCSSLPKAVRPANRPAVGS